MGCPPPLPDKALVLVNVFSDHTRLDTKEFESCFERVRRGHRGDKQGYVGMTRVRHQVFIYSTGTRLPKFLGGEEGT
jgi:hypothetical protein